MSVLRNGRNVGRDDRRRIALSLCLAAACCDVGYAAQDETNRVFDCGVNAVYLVRRLKGMDADLKEISERLARDAEKGSSIHDLETYLHGIGIRTDARLMRLSALCKTRGALAILLTHGKDGTGHFVTARVLDGGQLQVIDSLFGTRIDTGAAKSKERLPVILIDPPGRAWAWKLFALASVSLLGVLAIRAYYGRVLAIPLKWFNRRSQKKSFSWKTCGAYLKRYPLPTPKIHHDFYGLKCLFVNETEEPYMGNPQVRFCEGR